MPTTSRELWTERLLRYRSSSLSVRAFCRSEGVSEAAFYRWKKQLSDDQANASSSSFVSVELPNQTRKQLELKLPGGASISIDAHVEEAVLRSVLASVIAVTTDGDSA